MLCVYTVLLFKCLLFRVDQVNHRVYRTIQVGLSSYHQSHRNCGFCYFSPGQRLSTEAVMSLDCHCARVSLGYGLLVWNKKQCGIQTALYVQKEILTVRDGTGMLQACRPNTAGPGFIANQQ